LGAAIGWVSVDRGGVVSLAALPGVVIDLDELFDV
jgi:hypothetical protein